MLELHFINVADGDAILVEERQGDETFRLLVDAGRDVMQTPELPGSLRGTAADYLRSRGVEHIDALVVTHLHIDHFGGVREILQRVTVSDVWAGYIPEGPCALDRAKLADIKTVRGLAGCLERWGADCQTMRAMGCRLHTVTENTPLRLTERLTGEIDCCDPEASAFQRAAWTDMMAGRPVPEGLQYWSSKYRNPGSLRVRLAYAGRTVELAGDCYGVAWESQAQPCDILKVPHHGDGKALKGAFTPTLAEKLHPAWAVISCAAEYIPRKDRPSHRAAQLLEQQGAQVWFTDSFTAPWHQPEHRRSIDFIIEEDGTVLAPERQT